jgi:hypothetical protein
VQVHALWQAAPRARAVGQAASLDDGYLGEVVTKDPRGDQSADTAANDNQSVTIYRHALSSGNPIVPAAFRSASRHSRVATS